MINIDSISCNIINIYHLQITHLQVLKFTNILNFNTKIFITTKNDNDICYGSV